MKSCMMWSAEICVAQLKCASTGEYDYRGIQAKKTDQATHKHGMNSRVVKKIVVLITGQKCRLELLSKMQHIISPLSYDFEVSVVFSLAETSNFTNRHKYKKPFESTNCDIKKILGSTPYYMNDIVYPKLKVNEKITSMYDKKRFGIKFAQQRAHNHTKQYYTLMNSWDIIKKLNPDILIRIRDDALLSKSLDISSVLNDFEKKVMTSSQERHGGINDKLAIVSKQAIKSYLTKPFEVYNSYDENTLQGKFVNPEQFLSKVYRAYELKLVISDIKIGILGVS